ncbi:MAG: hypothetical protein GXP62_05430, partial [Oligoflexia bacterium]|nr:hypothetical protein [Oligoflexia bacterium]
MNILVADGDRRFTELLRGVIEREGHTVVIADDVARGLWCLDARKIQILVVGVGLPGGGADALVRTARERRDRGDVTVVLLATGAEDERRSVRALVAECDIRRILRRPFPMFDLVDLVREVAQATSRSRAGARQAGTIFGAQQGSPDPGLALPLDLTTLSRVTLPTNSTCLSLPLCQDNVRQMSRLWARRSSGIVHLSCGPDGAAGWMLVGCGGPLDSDGWKLLSFALHGGQMEFASRSASARGDHLGLGAMIFGRVRPTDGDEFLRRVSFLALRRAQEDAPLLALPLGTHTRKLLESARPTNPLGEIVSRLALDQGQVSADLQALDSMGLLEMGEPLVAGAKPGGRAGPVSRGRAKGGGSDTTAATSASSRAEISSLPTEIVPGAGRKKRTDPGGEWPRLRRRLAERGRHWATRQAAQQGRSEMAASVTRLRRELTLLRDHDAAVVLSVPAAAGPEMVEEAASRMRQRYRDMSTDPAIPREGQRLAEDILVCVERAYQEMVQGRPTRPRPAQPQGTEEERLLAAGRQRMEDQNWTQALHLLRRARDLRLDHPGILSCLGWATLHDQKMAPQRRVEEARALLLLAVQFAPEDGGANLLLARFLAEQCEFEAARRYAERAVRQLPDQPEPLALLRR